MQQWLAAVDPVGGESLPSCSVPLQSEAAASGNAHIPSEPRQTAGMHEIFVKLLTVMLWNTVNLASKDTAFGQRNRGGGVKLCGIAA